MKKDALKFEVLETVATKVTITISRRQLWRNFVEAWTEIAWDNYTDVDLLKETAEVLCCHESLTRIQSRLRNLFKNGSTILLLGDAMKKLDTADNSKLLRHIIVTDDIDGRIEAIFIPHEDIKF